MSFSKAYCCLGNLSSNPARPSAKLFSFLPYCLYKGWKFKTSSKGIPSGGILLALNLFTTPAPLSIMPSSIKLPIFNCASAVDTLNLKAPSLPL